MRVGIGDLGSKILIDRHTEIRLQSKLAPGAGRQQQGKGKQSNVLNARRRFQGHYSSPSIKDMAIGAVDAAFAGVNGH